MTDITEGPEWDKQRDELESSISSQLIGRAKAQGWISPKGKLTAKGATAALEFVLGIGTGFHLSGHPATNWMLNQCFLCSVRGVESRFPFVDAAQA